MCSVLNTEGPRRQACAMNAALDLSKRGVARSGGVIGEGREAAVIGCAKEFYVEDFGGVDDLRADFFGSFNARIDGIGHADEKQCAGRKTLADFAKNFRAVGFAGQLNIEATGSQAKEFGKQVRVV